LNLVTQPTIRRLTFLQIYSVLRARQFSEDSGPRAHAIRPESYMKMDNFYTATVYEKGAEVIRMYHTLLGPQRFRKVSPSL
jgi:aminopeptidase N